MRFAKVTEDILRLPLSKRELKVLCGFLLFADADGRSWPANQTIADAVNVDVSATRKAIRSLERKGLLLDEGWNEQTRTKIRRVKGGQIDPVSGQIDPVSGQIDPVSGQIDPGSNRPEKRSDRPAEGGQNDPLRGVKSTPLTDHEQTKNTAAGEQRRLRRYRCASDAYWSARSPGGTPPSIIHKAIRPIVDQLVEAGRSDEDIEAIFALGGTSDRNYSGPVLVARRRRQGRAGAGEGRAQRWPVAARTVQDPRPAVDGQARDAATSRSHPMGAVSLRPLRVRRPL